MNRLKPNKYPSICSVCSTTFNAYMGTLFFERANTLTKGRGRPEGKFIAFCNDHQDEAVSRLRGAKEETQETSRKSSWDNEEDNGFQDGMNKDHPEPKDISEEPIKEPEIMPTETPKEALQDKEGVALGIAQLLTKLTSNPGVNKDEVNKLIHIYAKQNNLASMGDINEALNKLGKPTPIQIEIIKGEDKTIIDTGLHHHLLPDIIQILSQGLHIYLVGPAGAGKTTLGDQASKALGKAFYFTGALDSKYGLIGFRDAHGNYHRTPFREAFEHGGVFLFDEVDASSANAMLSFNAALANGHMDFPDGIVERHPDFVAIASANTFGNGQDRLYVGRNQLDAATLDRFVTVEMNYDETLEKALVGTDHKAIAWVEFVQRTRKAVDTLKLRYVVSPRASLQGSKLLLAGMDAGKVAKMVLYRSMKAEDIAKVQQYAPIPR